MIGQTLISGFRRRHMKPERWQQIDQILDGAWQREGSQRKTFLDEA